MNLTEALEKRISEIQADIDRREREYADVPRLKAEVAAYSAALQAARGSLVPKTKLLPEAPAKPGVSPALRKAWAVAEEKRIAERVNRDAAIEAAWNDYTANKPANMEQALLELVNKNPYKTVSGEVLFRAAWMAWESQREDFVSTLAEAFKVTEAAIRQKVRSIWQHLNPSIWLKMPFMTKATIAPQKYMKMLEEAGKKLAKEQPEKPAAFVPHIVLPSKEATG